MALDNIEETEEIEAVDTVRLFKYDPTATITNKKIVVENETDYANLGTISSDPLVTVFQPIYENYNNYSAELVFYEEDLTNPLMPVYTALPIDLIGYQCTVTGGSATKIGSNRIRINIKSTDAFTDAYYKFLMPDYTTKILPSNTSEETLSLIEWSTPNVKVKDILHTVGISTYSTTEFITIPQQVYWRYEPALAAFKDLLSNNKI